MQKYIQPNIEKSNMENILLSSKIEVTGKYTIIVNDSSQMVEIEADVDIELGL